MFRRTPLILSALVLSMSCGRATVRETGRVHVVVSGVSFDASSVTVLAHNAECATLSQKITVSAPAGATRTCLLALKEGQAIDLVQRRMHFQAMTCGAKPTVLQSVGPCDMPQEAMRTETQGESCKTGSASATP